MIEFQAASTKTSISHVTPAELKFTCVEYFGTTLIIYSVLVYAYVSYKNAESSLKPRDSQLVDRMHSENSAL